MGARAVFILFGEGMRRTPRMSCKRLPKVSPDGALQRHLAGERGGVREGLGEEGTEIG